MQLEETVLSLSGPMEPQPTDQKIKLMELNGLKALFFDVYGTLLISGTGDIGVSERQNADSSIVPILEKLGMVILEDSESFDRRFVRLMNSSIIKKHENQKIIGNEYPEVDIRNIWKEILEELKNEKFMEGSLDEKGISEASVRYECMVNPVWPMPGAETLLRNIYGSGIKLGLVSNAQFYTEIVLSVLMDFRIGQEFFDPALMVYSYRVKMAKPSISLMKIAVSKIKKLYNIDPDEILYVGNDMLNDIYTASSCGCRTALFAGDKRSLRLRENDERCKDLKPDLVITSMDQLTNLLTQERI